MTLKVWIGYDIAEQTAYEVARRSLEGHATIPLTISRLTARDLIIAGLYRRPTVSRNGKLWDSISAAPMSTGHAIARFFIPFLTPAEGWALFTDGDVLFRRDVGDLVAFSDSSKAMMVVQHNYRPMETLKKNGDVQTQYPRKNWSSVMLWNLEHPAHQRLTLDMLNSASGRDLHRFIWLDDSEIGALPSEWNWLVGHSDPAIDPAIVHFTEGLPDVIGHQDDPYAEEWRTAASELNSYQWLNHARPMR